MDLRRAATAAAALRLALSAAGWLGLLAVAAVSRDLGDLQWAGIPLTLVVLGIPPCLAGGWARGRLRLAALGVVSLDAVAFLGMGVGALV